MVLEPQRGLRRGLEGGEVKTGLEVHEDDEGMSLRDAPSMWTGARRQAELRVEVLARAATR